MTIDKVWIDEQKVEKVNSGIFIFKDIQFFDKCEVGFYSTVQNIDNPDKWLIKSQPTLKELYLTIYCQLSVTISRPRPQADEAVNTITKSSFILTGDLDKPFNNPTLDILAQLYGTSADYCFSSFASDRQYSQKTERMIWLTPQEILNDLKQKEELLPTFLDKLHHL